MSHANRGKSMGLYLGSQPTAALAEDGQNGCGGAPFGPLAPGGLVDRLSGISLTGKWPAGTQETGKWDFRFEI